MKAMARIPAVMSAMGTPRNDLGTSSKSRRSRIPAKRISARAKPRAVDTCVLDFLQLNVARLFAGFTCGVELWSFLENAAQLSDAPFFLRMRRYVRRRIGKEVGDE